MNHADYVDRKAYFDILQFYEATKNLYPGLACTFLGKIGHHSCQEAGREALLACLGMYKSAPRRLNALIRTYERLVIASHQMYRFYIRDHVIIEEYLKRIRNDDWYDQESWDNNEFLELKEEL